MPSICEAASVSQVTRKDIFPLFTFSLISVMGTSSLLPLFHSGFVNAQRVCICIDMCLLLLF